MADTLDAGRKAVEAYFIAQWANATPYGLDGQPFTATAPSVRLTILDGAAIQASVGQTNRVITNIGVLSLQLFTDGALGSSSWRGLAETLLTMFHGVCLDAAGAVITSPGQTALVRFSPPEVGRGCHPYVANQTPGTPFRMTTINAPFVRYQLR